ncbi:MAG: hypothetical protein Kow00105_17830 [Phycisphaeraceae bacterium]
MISTIALLVGILLPALGAARKTAQRVQCASRLRQVNLSMLSYAEDYKGKFPPNTLRFVPGQGMVSGFWYDKDRIGQYLPGFEEAGTGSIGGGVLTCPADGEGVARTYAINIHSGEGNDPDRYFTLESVKRTSRMLLFGESWAYQEDPNGSIFADSEIGGYPTPFRPATWFGLNGSVNPAKTGLRARFGNVKSMIRYNLHADADNEAFEGSVNMTYIDGHVTNKSPGDLVDTATGKSTYDTLWSEIDEKVEQ